MQKSEIIEKLKKIVSAIDPDLRVSEVGVDTRLIEDIGLNSLTYLMMGVYLEREFGFAFDYQSAAAFRTVGDICDYVEEHS